MPSSHILSSKLSDSSSVSFLYLEPHTPGPKQRQLTRRPCLPARTLISPEQCPENCPPTSINQVSHHPRAHPLPLMHTHIHRLTRVFYALSPLPNYSLCVLVFVSGSSVSFLPPCQAKAKKADAIANEL